jgi:serine protease Do
MTDLDEPPLPLDPPAPTPPPTPDRAAPPARRRLPRGASTLATVMLAAAVASGTTLAVTGAVGPQATPSAAATSGALASSTAAAAGSTSAGLADVISAAEQSVVTVNVQTTAAVGPFGQPRTVSGSGSGVIVSTDGYILTAQHVIEGETSLSVTLADGSTHDATLTAASSTADVALIKIDATGLEAAPIGNDSSLEVGDLVVALGNPLGQYAGSATLGIVSGLDRSIDVVDSTTRQTLSRSGLIQTDAALNEGNSGGPLIDAQGRVVGIATATSSSAQGLGFATPITAAAALLAEAGVTTP